MRRSGWISRWYLTGFLVPANAGQEQGMDADADDEVLETAEPPGATDDDAPSERTAARERRLPSSMGLSVLLPGEAQRLSVRLTWGDYRLEGTESSGPEIWKRIARDGNVGLDVSSPVNQPTETEGITSSTGTAWVGIKIADPVQQVSADLIGRLEVGVVQRGALLDGKPRLDQIQPGRVGGVKRTRAGFGSQSLRAFL